MLVNFQDTVAVKAEELRFLSVMLKYRREMSARFAEVAVKNGNYGAYINLRDVYNHIDELLSLSMFDGYRDECKVVFPKYEDDGESDPFFDDATLDYLYSDGSCISEADSADVPF